MRNVEMRIKDNYGKIMETIQRACQRVNRNPSEVKILGVAKDHSSEQEKKRINVD